MFDIVSLIKTIGYFGIFGFIFAESGLFVGFFLPGDSLLFTAGFLASQGFLNIWALVIVTFISAVVGVSVGYAFGKKVGPAIFNKEDSLFFKKEYLERARIFYDRHGGKTLILARFMPFVRTFAPILAGVGKMRYGAFLFYNIIGGFLWAVGLCVLGYFLGEAVPNVDRYLLPIIAAIVLLSVAPGFIHLMRDSEKRRKIIDFIFRRVK